MEESETLSGSDGFGRDHKAREDEKEEEKEEFS